MKLILSILAARTTENGAGLKLGEMIDKKVILAAMPLHDYDDLKLLQRKWLKLFAYPWHQPIGTLRPPYLELGTLMYYMVYKDDVKDYFGERVGLYFLYLQHYVTLLIIPGILGLITYIGKIYPIMTCNLSIQISRHRQNRL